jgi:hypothetical protein
MGQQFGGRGLASAAEVIEGIGQIGRVPVDDRGDHQVQARGAELLRVLAAIGDAPLLEGADDLGERVALLALVQTRLAELPELRRFQPIQHEQGALDPAQLLQSKIELILALECRQPLQHRGWQDCARVQRRDQAPHLVPVFADDVRSDAPPEQRLQLLVGGDGLERARAIIAKGLTVREAVIRLKVGKTALYAALRG